MTLNISWIDFLKNNNRDVTDNHRLGYPLKLSVME
jgi:hypothetical protein